MLDTGNKKRRKWQVPLQQSCLSLKNSCFEASKVSTYSTLGKKTFKFI